MRAPCLGTSEPPCSAGDAPTWNALELIDISIEAGDNLFDTADVYSSGECERILGATLKGRRDDVLIATKSGQATDDGPMDGGSSRPRLIRAVDSALQRLDTDRIDLFQIHAFDGATPQEETI